MSAHRDPILRTLLALDDAAQIAALTALYGDAPPSTRPTTTAPALGFTPLDGTLTTSAKGGLLWRPTPWPAHVVNVADADAIHVCIDHSYLTRRSRRAPLEITTLRAELAEWRAVRGIYTCRGYGPPRTWRMPTLALVLRDVLHAVPTVHPALRPHVAGAIVRASTYARNGGPSPARIVAEAELDGREGLLQCALYFSDDASQGIRDWLCCFPSVLSSNSSDDVTMARVIRLNRATAGPPDPPPLVTAYHDANVDDEAEPADDDREDLSLALALHTIRRYLAPCAWDDINVESPTGADCDEQEFSERLRRLDPQLKRAIARAMVSQAHAFALLTGFGR